MAIIKNGILGGFKGKAGAVVGYEMYGQDCMRGIPRLRTSHTPNEVVNSSKFGLVQDTLSQILGFVKVGFRNYYTKTGGIRGAISYNRKHAVKEDENGFFLDPNEFVVAGGTLPGAKLPEFSVESPGIIKFKWDSNIPEGADGLDQVMLLAIDLQGKNASFCEIGEFRKNAEASLSLDGGLEGKLVDVYMAFVAKDRSRQSTSQYLGPCQLQ
ncbi:MAG: hypothetical protein EOO01_01075 [Chitinophagaceae bacterium]|nr:MAG: hypothetical protein EOO01_01075 [Chitinophagaceae bacterium]